MIQNTGAFQEEGTKRKVRSWNGDIHTDMSRGLKKATPLLGVGYRGLITHIPESSEWKEIRGKMQNRICGLSNRDENKSWELELEHQRAGRKQGGDNQSLSNTGKETAQG